ncbi:MAG: saccharopine dehydrogenase [bacterium]|nr:saccharopine dehydrogenase [bacterium]
MKKVLVLGAGLVTRPLVGYLLDRGYAVTCASRTVAKAEKLIDGHPHGTAYELNLKDEGRLADFIKNCDLAVSLVPFAFHPTVARMCIEQRKPMVTTSYVSEEMEQLDGAAKDAGVTILNEIGVDPGIDHMSAMRIIDDVRGRGGKIVAFKSYCGGLPAPESNDNPFGYKFSWAPRGVLLASRNGARYLLDGRRVEVEPERLFRDMHVLQVEDFGDFEAYPNRDSIAYVDIYGLQGIKTLYRGTLRNMGWCDTLYNFRRLGLLDLEEVDVAGQTYADFMRARLGAGSGSDELRLAAARKMGVPPDALPAWNLHWLGMFSERALGVDRISPLDALGNLMFEKLAFQPDERDMLVLYHDFRAEYPNGASERITSRMIDFGFAGGDSSMSRTVSLPAAIGVDRILSGKIETTGVLRPVTPEIYEPVLDALSELGIECVEATETLEPGAVVA